MYFYSVKKNKLSLLGLSLFQCCYKMFSPCNSDEITTQLHSGIFLLRLQPDNHFLQQ